MKRIAYFACLLLILVVFAGCAKSSPIQEFDEPSAADLEVSAAPAPGAETTPEKTPEATPDVTATPETTPSPTTDVFDIEDVEMQPTPGSSCFSEIGYDPEWEVLVVRFRDSGSVYKYSDFPMEEWNKFISASSLGSWYNKHIKGKYEYERVS